MNREDCKNTKERFKVLFMEMTRYDKIILTFFMVVFFGLGMFSEALGHMLYDAITEYNQPDVSEKAEVVIDPEITSIFGEEEDGWCYVVDTQTDKVYIACQTWPNIAYIPARDANGEQLKCDQLGDHKFVAMDLSTLRHYNQD